MLNLYHKRPLKFSVMATDSVKGIRLKNLLQTQASIKLFKVIHAFWVLFMFLEYNLTTINNYKHS